MEASFVIAKLFTFVLSLGVAYLAYHGYRRSGQTPMLYVSGGFVFIGAGAICEGLIYHVFGTTIASAALVQAAIVSSGMVLVLISLTK
ncbi:MULTISPECIES: hypothetical protein [Natrialbaceae]|jgi:hypothetical protein|uniref:Uncharacterized protein n=3 Tax=Natrialbaceae TaxID=1644061 RepID=M0AG88_NATA1|nr:MULTISPECIES: hypothetical protein [Natrialbaceae]ELY66330.1 hypothetical protein C489_13271 [Natrinema versiforme JCM 10478]ELY97396.1 hypothetical protein C481_20141 [Natrialba asiatica DSM 12278]QCS44507.1 hypothetical protein FEJ81_19485 [Natrinema versiforme]UHQ98393.1 hypothetical protein HYG81_20250 [Natrinema zhouii]UHQ99051.1 hypothetical protein HYG81_25240 [Natrinema zhouii]